MKLVLILVLLCINCAPTLERPARSDLSDSSDQSDKSDPASASTSVTSSSSSSASGSTPTSSSAPPLATPDFLKINEILYDAVGKETDGYLFVELYGTPGSTLKGHRIQFLNGDNKQVTEEVLFKTDVMIPEDGLFVVADAVDGNPKQTHVANADFIDNFDPQNGPDAISILDERGEILDLVGYGENFPEGSDGVLFEANPAVDVASGMSLSRDSGIDTNSNSDDFFVNEMPNPGEFGEKIFSEAKENDFL